MLAMLLISHLLGDYVLQFNFLAHWKARSIWGVVAHGAIVTATTILCAMLVDVTWWGYALLIGILHTGIDVIKARVVHAKDVHREMHFYLMDQFTHILVILGMVWATGATHLPTGLLANMNISLNVLMGIAGYLLLLQPAWVLLRFIVRGIWGADAAPHLGAGEKFAPMVERVLIASLVLFGLFYLTPMVLLPRRLTTVRVQSNGMAVWMQLTTHWAETFMSVMLAMGVGLMLRLMVM